MCDVRLLVIVIYSQQFQLIRDFFRKMKTQKAENTESVYFSKSTYGRTSNFTDITHVRTYVLCVYSQKKTENLPETTDVFCFLFLFFIRKNYDNTDNTKST